MKPTILVGIILLEGHPGHQEPPVLADP